MSNPFPWHSAVIDNRRNSVLGLGRFYPKLMIRLKKLHCFQPYQFKMALFETFFIVIDDRRYFFEILGTFEPKLTMGFEENCWFSANF